MKITIVGTDYVGLFMAVLLSQHNEVVALDKGFEFIVYEPVLAKPEIFKSKVVSDLAAFKEQADLIVANRVTDDISDVLAKVYTRGLFGGDS